jgi:hypothetical protein
MAKVMSTELSVSVQIQTEAEVQTWTVLDLENSCFKAGHVTWSFATPSQQLVKLVLIFLH